MSGHSKWANIKRHKAVVDAKKGAVYAKVAREIIVAAKLGGGDPAANFRLRTAIEKAKADGVPNDNIQRAIEKGTGGGSADQIEELTYEGYGPGGVAILVRCATDNRNRTAGDIRSYFSKFGGNMGESGCVSWMFKERGELALDRPQKLSDDDLMMLALELGAEDIDTSSDEYITIICESANLEAVKEGLKKAGLEASSADVTMSPISSASIEDKDIAKQLLKLLDNLESHDDVQQVYANFEMDSDWMTELV
ncbi:MAG: YebC/PmpR family DNA-binding transcriptional regulator [Candidatus Obscuribacterales bacterium]|nr:YebC/PmpR family DNA-binding transcriptional regulator [Candidatus Obscuribacterales bacterium]